MAKRSNRGLGIGIGVFGAIVLICAGMMAVSALGNWLVSLLNEGPEAGQAQPVGWEADSAELTVAASPVMAPVLRVLADSFNTTRQQTSDGHTMSVQVLPYDPGQMVEEALIQPRFQAMAPDSSLWLDRLEQRWADQGGAGITGGVAEGGAVGMPGAQRRIAEQTRYAVSPIVLAAWEDVARGLGWPDRPVSWQDVQRRATQDPDFKWSHPSTEHASGLLAVLAEFYAGAGLVRGLTTDAATDQRTLDYVQAVEGTVRFYGENEDVVVERLREEGRSFLDLFVAQERVVIDWNRTHPDAPLVALYPAEGTLWTDHPLALLELGQGGGELAVTENQRLTHRAFIEFLKSAAAQKTLLDSGYRPADLSIALDSPGSPFADTDKVDWRQPQTTLQMPSAEVVDVVRDYWYYTKRPTNVYLVVDTSGSMEGEKIDRARAALKSFLAQIRGERDRVGVIEFGSGLKNRTPLRPLDDLTRQYLNDLFDGMTADGGTALIDGVYEALDTLLAQNDEQAINAVVVMTDGLENESARPLYTLDYLRRSRPALPLVIFTIGFGDDADEVTLREIARIGDGQFRRADETDIEELYRVISTYF